MKSYWINSAVKCFVEIYIFVDYNIYVIIENDEGQRFYLKEFSI